MSDLLKGAPVAASINEKTKELVRRCEEIDRVPSLMTLRIGSNPSDVAYERSLSQKITELGMDFDAVVLDEDVAQSEVEKLIENANVDPAIDAIMIFRPLDKRFDENAICNKVAPSKDVDGVSARSLASVFMGDTDGFAPATAKACIEICDHYGIELEGNHVVVVGRSLVIGKPVGMLALDRNATVTFCHSRTSELPSITRSADIVISAIGRPHFFEDSHFAEGQTVIDVGINIVEGRICGDVDAESVQGTVERITPVPGGVGTVATATLLNNVALACARAAGLE